MHYTDKIKEFVKNTPANSPEYVDGILELCNYDESQVPSYTVESPLRAADGTLISTAAEWMNNGRPRVLAKMAEELYGDQPPRPDIMEVKTLSVREDALDNTAIRKEVELTFAMNNGRRHSIIVLLYVPRDRRGPVPTFLNLNFHGNHTVTDEKDVIITGTGNPNKNFLNEESRGCHCERNSFREVVARGYASCTACYHDLFPDSHGCWDKSIFMLFGNFSDFFGSHSRYSAIGGWAWGLSRILDYLETEETVDSTRVMLHGHSRLGKTALWAGARDSRFKIVVSNDSGLGGAAMTKRCFGEIYAYLAVVMPHWFVSRTAGYIAGEEKQDFDQHFLLSLIAPRQLVVASASEDAWADPRGEYLSAWHAGEVYKLFGSEVLKTPEQPAVGEVITGDISYHYRNGDHAQTLWDWEHYLDIADKYL